MLREHTKTSVRDLFRGPKADGRESVPVLARRTTRLAPVLSLTIVATPLPRPPLSDRAICEVSVLLEPSNAGCDML